LATGAWQLLVKFFWRAIFSPSQRFLPTGKEYEKNYISFFKAHLLLPANAPKGEKKKQ